MVTAAWVLLLLVACCKAYNTYNHGRREDDDYPFQTCYSCADYITRSSRYARVLFPDGVPVSMGSCLHPQYGARCNDKTDTCVEIFFHTTSELAPRYNFSSMVFRGCTNSWLKRKSFVGCYNESSYSNIVQNGRKLPIYKTICVCDQRNCNFHRADANGTPQIHTASSQKRRRSKIGHRFDSNFMVALIALVLLYLFTCF